MMLVKERSDCLDRLSDHCGQLHGFFAKFELAPADARYVQEIIDQSLEVLDLPLDHRQFPLGPSFAGPCLLQQVNSRLDRSQRVAKFVRQDSQKLFLAAISVPKLLLSPLPVGDVCEHPQDSNHLAPVVGVRGCGNNRPQFLAVRSAEAEVVYLGDTMTPLLQSRCHQGSVFGGYEVEHRATWHFSDRNAKHFGHPGVGERCPTLRVEDADAFEGCLDNPSESLFALPELHLSPPAVGDVNTRADVPGESAIWGEPWNPVLQNPAIFAVVPPQPVLHCKGGASVQCRDIGLPASLQVIGVDALGPARAHLLLDGPSSEVEPLLVEIIAELICVGAPDQDRGGISQSVKPLLTLPKCLLDPLPLGDVLGDPGDPHDPTRTVPDREAPVPDPPDCAIGTNDSVFVCRGFATFKPFMGPQCCLTVLGVNGFKVRHRSLIEGLARSAPERLVGRANVGNLGAVEFKNPEHIIDMICQLAEALLAFSLLLLGPMALSDIPEDDDNTLGLAVRVSDGGGIVLHGSRRSILGDEHHFVIGKYDLSVTDDFGNWKIVSPPV